MSLICWDTVLLIRWIEGTPGYADRLGSILDRMQERGDILCTSAFSLAEVMVAPVLGENLELANAIRAAFGSDRVRVLPFNSETVDRYAVIRAIHRFSHADSMQLACAGQAGVDLYLTGEPELAGKLVTGIQFIAGIDANVF
jgi:putative NIF3 family GTP cyclohydrolase 1 type 2